MISGNLENKQDKHGWFIGHFMNNQFKTNDFEVKWGMHPKGYKKPQVAANQTAKTISILVKGKFLVGFPDQNKEITLEKIGDYVYFDSKVYHTSEALEDSIIITVRWHSIPGDQQPLIN